MAQKKVRELKNRGKRQCMILLLLRELRQNSCLAKIKSQLEIKLKSCKSLKGENKKKLYKGQETYLGFCELLVARIR